MTEQRIIELIHAELDGELTTEERAELSRALLADPEARAAREQWGRLFGELEKLESVAPPPALAASVLSALEGRADAPRVRAISRPWYAGTGLRYAAVFVGALLIGAALFAPGIRSTGGPDVSDLVGTIGGSGAAARQSPIDRADIDLAQVRGTVNAYRLGSQLVVELDLRVSEAVEVRATHAGQTFQVSLDATSGSKAERVLWLPDEAEDSAPVRFQIYADGRLIHEDMLRSSAAG